MARRVAGICLLMAAFLVLALQLLAAQSLAQSSTATGQNLLRNGDFRDGLTGWTPGVLTPSAYAGYPKWGVIGTVGTGGRSLSAYLDVRGGAAAYLESDPFMLPEVQGVWTLNSTFWGSLNPTTLQVEIRTQAGIYTLDSLKPPMTQSGQEPIVEHYRIPVNFSGQDIAIRFTCADTLPAHAIGAVCAFAQLAMVPPVTLPPVNSVSASVVVALGLGLAAAGVALAQAASASASSTASSTGSSGAQGQVKPGFHLPTFVRSLALVLVGYLSKRYCCACAGACNHTGPHSFCPAHDPRTLSARMAIVYKVYCRHCGRKLEEHECKGPVTEPEGTLSVRDRIEPERSQPDATPHRVDGRDTLRPPH